ncbi:hypothetical protein OPU71_17000 [Niveibacterium sp. 24ML]|uniref:hypothetical protein n=1 Tax=Niveibacterium sp. 24ML TaxID=2985512 RepID=UPI002271F365|nr:hypothetical protein [Niveibacterium sp. 24ML]MCX9157824.1 hypothetical protein [Niveibacterium sp. 24ML]
MILAEIDAAIEKAQDGILKYVKLMDMVDRVDVSEDADFQRQYNAFYRVQRRPVAWYHHYYSLMQRLKGQNPEFGEVLDEIYKVTGRYEPSFASKLVATIDPAKPVWDVHVLRNTDLTAPSYANKNKLALAKEAYAAMERWYAHFLASPEGALFLNEFDQRVANPQRFTPLKKVDFILWQHRTP